MLTNTHFIILFVAFAVSIFLGGLLRVFYYSHEKSFFLKRLINVMLCQLLFPVLAYKEIVKHKSDFIHEINKDKKLSAKRKIKLRKTLNSNRRIALRITWNSIIRFKYYLDSNIKLLNSIRTERGEEVILVKVHIKREKEESPKEYKRYLFERYT